MSTNMYLDVKTKFFKGFGDKTRLAILHSLKEGELTVSEIVEKAQMKQSNVSQHLACLRGCGIIKSRQDGKFTYYSIRNDEILRFLDAADSILKGISNELIK